MSDTDLRQFPRLEVYLKGLPHGLKSYPEAKAKASMLRDALLDKPLKEVAKLLPDSLAELVMSPPLVSTWVQSVLVQAIFLVMADHHRMSDGIFSTWTHRTQKALLGGPLYRSIAALASPALLLNGASMRWHSFHRGSDVHIKQAGPGEAVLLLTFPQGLSAPTNLVGIGGGFQAVAEVSKAESVTVRVMEMTQTLARYQFRWR
jgi:hypothetical protein